MMMTEPKDEMLDDLFAQARRVTPEVAADLMARVMADAERSSQPAIAKPAPRRDLMSRILDVLGGWSVVGGLTAATVAGVWIGISPPAALDDLTAGLSGDVVALSLFDEVPFGFEEGLADG